MTNEEWESFSPEQRADRFREELLAALDKSVETRNSSHVHMCRVNWFGNIPEKYAGNRDRTFGYYTVTTVLKTFREDGLAKLIRFWLPLDELRTACKEVLRHDIPEKLLPLRPVSRVECELAADKVEAAFLALQPLDWANLPADIGGVVHALTADAQRAVLALREYASTGKYVKPEAK